MSSRCRAEAWLLAFAAALAAGCDREHREARGMPVAESAPARVALSTLEPATGRAPAGGDPRGAQYEGNAMHVAQGARYYRWFNCSGCHANGGGGMGPALRDGEWRYGGRIEQIYDSISEGRPNGMPAFREQLPPQQIWQLAAFVRALSGNVPPSVAPSRREGLQGPPPLNRTEPRGDDAGDPAPAQVPAT